VKFNFIELIRSAFVKRDQKFRQHLTVFLVCLLIAVFVWFTIQMDNEYQEVVPIPLKFTIAPRSQILVEASDSILFVELKDKGSELLRYRYMKSGDFLLISTKNVILSQRENYSTGFILTSSLLDDLGYQFDLAGKVLSISPDTIYLSFMSEKHKKVPVSANLQIKTLTQHMLYGSVSYQPDSVSLRGPQDIIDNISVASLGTLELTDLSANTEKTLPVLISQENRSIIANPEQVNVFIPVEKFTEAVIQVPITIISDSNLHIRLFPDAVELNCLVALKDYAQVTPGLFKVIADFRSVNLETEKEVRLKVTEYPSTLKINRIEPERAEFIIIKK
jgi:YbbR domain-containing protein